MARERRWIVAVAGALAVAGLVSCSDEARDDLADSANSIVEDVGDAVESVASNVAEAAEEAIDDTAEAAARNLAAQQAEEQFAEAGNPIDDEGLACEATVADGADNLEIRCSGTTEDGGAAELTGQTTELPGASITELEGEFVGTVDGAEIFTTDRLGG